MTRYPPPVVVSVVCSRTVEATALTYGEPLCDQQTPAFATAGKFQLIAARQAYGRMMERLSSNGAGAGGALARIGASLRRGDLVAANRTLDGLESKALRVLRGLREHVDLIPAIVPSLRKPN